MNGKDPELLEALASELKNRNIKPTAFHAMAEDAARLADVPVTSVEFTNPRADVVESIQGFRDLLKRIEDAVEMNDWRFELKRIELQAMTQLLLSSFHAWADYRADLDFERYQQAVLESGR